jgi:hypothetical protein
MSEAERAKYYQAHKDDEDEWGEPERPPSSFPKRRLASMISVRFSPDEARAIRQAAEAADESLSQFVRMAALQRCQHPRLAPSITGTIQTMQETIRLQIDASGLHGTSTEGGSGSSSGSNWTSSSVLTGIK